MASYRNREVILGFEACFDPELDMKYQCPICLAALRDPVQTKCGHRFCRSCLKGVCISKRFVKCPVDNTWFDANSDIFEDIAVKREVLSLNVKCNNHEESEAESCNWSGELRDLEGHMANCDFVNVSCNYKCGKNIQRRHLDNHLEDCPLRLEKCTHCQKKTIFADLTKHQLLECLRFPVNCVVCGETGILREEIPGHLNQSSGNCPLVVVDCRLKHIGCMFKDKRKNMAKHYQMSNEDHMMLLCSQLEQVASTLLSTRDKLDITQSTCVELSTHCEQQSRCLAQLKKTVADQADVIERLNNLD